VCCLEFRQLHLLVKEVNGLLVIDLARGPVAATRHMLLLVPAYFAILEPPIVMRRSGGGTILPLRGCRGKRSCWAGACRRRRDPGLGMASHGWRHRFMQSAPDSAARGDVASHHWSPATDLDQALFYHHILRQRCLLLQPARITLMYNCLNCTASLSNSGRGPRPFRKSKIMLTVSAKLSLGLEKQPGH